MNRRSAPQAARRDSFSATCAALQPGFARLVLPLLIACAALLLIDCTILRDYLARGPRTELLQPLAAPAVATGPWIPGDLEIQAADPVTSAQALATLCGLLIFMTATSVFLFDTTLRVGAALHRRNPPRSLG
jgi:hypothetical protein